MLQRSRDLLIGGLHRVGIGARSTKGRLRMKDADRHDPASRTTGGSPTQPTGSRVLHRSQLPRRPWGQLAPRSVRKASRAIDGTTPPPPSNRPASSTRPNPRISENQPVSAKDQHKTAPKANTAFPRSAYSRPYRRYPRYRESRHPARRSRNTAAASRRGAMSNPEIAVRECRETGASRQNRLAQRPPGRVPCGACQIAKLQQRGHSPINGAREAAATRDTHFRHMISSGRFANS